MAAAVTAGRAAGYLCWGGGGPAGPDPPARQGVALLYLIFLGLYPVVKGAVESLRRLPLEWALKLAFFNLALTLCWSLFRELFLPRPARLADRQPARADGAGNVVFVLYDIGLSQAGGMAPVPPGPPRKEIGEGA